MALQLPRVPYPLDVRYSYRLIFCIEPLIVQVGRHFPVAGPWVTNVENGPLGIEPPRCRLGDTIPGHTESIRRIDKYFSR